MPLQGYSPWGMRWEGQILGVLELSSAKLQAQILLLLGVEFLLLVGLGQCTFGKFCYLNTRRDMPSLPSY